MNEKWKEFIDDLRNPIAWKIKMCYFTILFGIVSMWPQFTVYQKHLCLRLTDAGAFSFINSAIAIVAPVVSGFVADKMGNFKILLSSVTLLAAGSGSLYLLVPPAVPDAFRNGTHCQDDASVDQQFLDSYYATFWWFLLVNALFMFLFSSAFTLLESSVMTFSESTGLNYGFQRAWGVIAAVSSSFCGGVVVDNFGFTILFLMASACITISACLMITLDMTFRVSPSSYYKDVRYSMRNSDTRVVLLAVLLSGVFFGYFETYMYLYLFSLGASHTLLGLTVTTGGSVEFFLQLASKSIVRALGEKTIICISFLCISAKGLGLGLIKSPELALLIEAFDSVSAGLFFTTVIMYLTANAKASTLASMRGLVGAVQMGVGKMIGASIGIPMQTHLSARMGWFVTSLLGISVFFIISSLFFCTSISRRKARSREKQEKQANSYTNYAAEF